MKTSKNKIVRIGLRLCWISPFLVKNTCILKKNLCSTQRRASSSGIPCVFRWNDSAPRDDTVELLPPAKRESNEQTKKSIARHQQTHTGDEPSSCLGWRVRRRASLSSTISRVSVVARVSEKISHPTRQQWPSGFLCVGGHRLTPLTTGRYPIQRAT